MTEPSTTPELPESRDPAVLLRNLENFTGPVTEFWALVAETLARIIGADIGVVVEKQNEGSGGWRLASAWPRVTHEAPLPHAFSAVVSRLAEECLSSSPVIDKAPGNRQSGHAAIIGVRIASLSPNSPCAAIFLRPGGENAGREAAERLKLLSIIPSIYRANRALQKARTDLRQFGSVLDLMTLVTQQKRFLAGAMVLCNELAARHNCERVSLGWLKGGYVRLQAMSHTGRFDPKMQAVKRIEMVMEEALNQDNEIAFPPGDDATYISRDHETLSREHGVPFVCSVPIRIGGGPTAVLTCERNARAFDEADLSHLRLCADQVAWKLDDLYHRDGWFLVRWAKAARRGLGKVIGIEHTWTKMLSLLILAGILFLVFYKAPYRIEATFSLRSDRVAHLPAPFAGFIGRADVEIGDVVRSGDPLFSMETRDLELERSAAIAEGNRRVREIEKARAENALAEMRISMAMAEQNRVRLEMIDLQLSQAVVTAPFDAVVVAGNNGAEIKERIGAPVERGDVLLRVARLEDLYVESLVDERDIDDVTTDLIGEVAFASQPQLKFPITVNRIEPVATARDGNSVFLVRCQFSGKPEEWFRPGMGGLCKIDVERRSLLWIFTHRTIDFLRMLFWW